MLPAVPFEGRRLVDGGVSNNTPISHAVAHGAKRIYVLATQDLFAPRRVSARQGAVAAAIDGVALLVGNRLEADLQRYAGEAEIVLLPAPNPRQVQPIDFSQSDRLIAEAAVAAHERLDEAGEWLPPLKRLA